MWVKPKALLNDTTKLKAISHHSCQLIREKRNSSSIYAVVVFSHHRDVKVALDDLRNTGFSSDYIVLVARNVQRHLWCSRLITNNYFDAEKFDFGKVAQKFFAQLFNRGKYLILISGKQHDVNYAAKVMGRRKDHVEVWCFE